MTFWDKFCSNEIMISAIVGWTVAQGLKTIIDCALNKSFSPERLVGSGGMPSSHSATVCALTTSAGMLYGVESFEFAICFVFAAVVMYDAIGVRLETGKQAQIINELTKAFEVWTKEELPEIKLKEFVGHTPIQVIAGILIGIAHGCVMHFWIFPLF